MASSKDLFCISCSHSGYHVMVRFGSYAGTWTKRRLIPSIAEKRQCTPANHHPCMNS